MPLNIDKVPRYIADDLRKRGHSDAKIKSMSADKAFVEWCIWNGYGGGEEVLAVMKHLQKAKR